MDTTAYSNQYRAAKAPKSPLQTVALAVCAIGAGAVVLVETVSPAAEALREVLPLFQVVAYTVNEGLEHLPEGQFSPPRFSDQSLAYSTAFHSGQVISTGSLPTRGR